MSPCGKLIFKNPKTMREEDLQDMTIENPCEIRPHIYKIQRIC
jgi:hypothetical protein